MYRRESISPLGAAAIDYSKNIIIILSPIFFFFLSSSFLRFLSSSSIHSVLLFTSLFCFEHFSHFSHCSRVCVCAVVLRFNSLLFHLLIGTAASCVTTAQPKKNHCFIYVLHSCFAFCHIYSKNQFFSPFCMRTIINGERDSSRQRAQHCTMVHLLYFWYIVNVYPKRKRKKMCEEKRWEMREQPNKSSEMKCKDWPPKMIHYRCHAICH